MHSIIIIPAYQPDQRLLDLLDELVQMTSSEVVVVNDGSESSCNGIFDRAEQYDGVRLLVHSHNRGKGAALRTGFRYIIENEPTCSSVITADADGQHKARDIARVCSACMENPDCLILGVREFNGYVPLRSRLGNGLTKRLYGLLFKQRLSDTQTGLRGFPANTLDMLLKLKGERYSYELEMLLSFNTVNTPVVEIPVATVYEKNNNSSHFRPFFDSLKIYTTLIRWWLGNHD